MEEEKLKEAEKIRQEKFIKINKKAFNNWRLGISDLYYKNVGKEEFCLEYMRKEYQIFCGEITTGFICKNCGSDYIEIKVKESDYDDVDDEGIIKCGRCINEEKHYV